MEVSRVWENKQQQEEEQKTKTKTKTRTIFFNPLSKSFNINTPQNKF